MPRTKLLLTAAALLCLNLAATTEPATQPSSGMLADGKLEKVGTSDSWQASALSGAEVSVAKDPASTDSHPALLITVDKVTSTDWNAQVFQTGLSVLKDHHYTFSFTAKASASRKIAVFIQELQSPYKMLTQGQAVDLSTDAKPYTVEFTATSDSTDGKLTIAVGQATGTITLSDMALDRQGDLDAPQ